MSQKTFSISTKTIAEIKESVFKDRTEVCAFLKLQSLNTSNLILTNIVIGEEKDGRGTCRHQDGYSSFIYHTHPISSYAYPSVEDIIKVIKNYNRIRRSIIATKWGVWDIKNTDKSNIYSIPRHNELVIYLQHYLDRIGRATKSTNGYEMNDIGKSKTLKDSDMNIISENIKKIEKTIHLEINLHLWNEIKNGLTLS